MTSSIFATGQPRRLLAVGAACALALGLVLGSGSASAWSLKEAAKPYAGAKIHCAGDGYAPYIGYEKLSKEFTEI